MRLRWTAPALRDLQALGDYIARDNPVAAAKTTTAIFEQSELLGAHPYAGHAGRVSGTRELVVSDTSFIAATMSNCSPYSIAPANGRETSPDKADARVGPNTRENGANEILIMLRTSGNPKIPLGSSARGDAELAWQSFLRFSTERSRIKKAICNNKIVRRFVFRCMFL